MSGLHITKNIKNKYFLTITVIEWIEVFTQDYYFQLLANSLNYCTLKKGLVVNGYVFMRNHIHLIADTIIKPNLHDIIRDFKRHTTKEIKEMLIREKKLNLLNLFKNSDQKRTQNICQIWQKWNWPVICDEPYFYNQKLDYIHNNPIEKGYVDNPCNWKYSSAKDYYTNKRSPVNVTTE
jgi:REP element-mobilizing transposase RayT